MPRHLHYAATTSWDLQASQVLGDDRQVAGSSRDRHFVKILLLGRDDLVDQVLDRGGR